MEQILDVKKIRSKWILSLNSLLIYTVAYHLFFSAVSQDFSLMLYCLPVLFWNFILYRCSYKKNGTRVLNWVLVMSGLGIFKSACELSKDFSIFVSIFVLFDAVFYIWFLYASIDMKELNRKMKTVIGA